MRTVNLRVATVMSLAAFVAGCSSTGGGAGGLLGSSAPKPAVEPAATPQQVVQGTCPTVNLRDGTAYYRTYAKGGEKDKDPTKVIHQASLADTTRQCKVSGDNVIIDVAAAGRVVAGPAGGPGTVTMPIRVAVVDGDKTLYSELTKYPAELPAGAPTTQFLFNKPGITIPRAAADTAKVYVGFDEGPYNTP